MLRSGVVVLALTLGAALPGRSSAQGRGVIVGTVVDSTPITPPIVVLAGTKIVALVDSLGRFVISNVPPGNYKFIARALLHFPETLTVRVTIDTLRLKPIHLRLDAHADSLLQSLHTIAPAQHQ
jgi:hypothetical protein